MDFLLTLVGHILFDVTVAGFCALVGALGLAALLVLRHPDPNDRPPITQP